MYTGTQVLLQTCTVTLTSRLFFVFFFTFVFVPVYFFSQTEGGVRGIDSPVTPPPSSPRSLILFSASGARRAGLPSMPPSTCYTLSITAQHQSTPAANTADYCSYRFLNRKIYSLNITVDTRESIEMSEWRRGRTRRDPSHRTPQTCPVNTGADQETVPQPVSLSATNRAALSSETLTNGHGLNYEKCPPPRIVPPEEQQVLLSFSLCFTYDR